MVDLDPTVRVLHTKRQELLAELKAVDSAIAALEGARTARVKHKKDERPQAAALVSPGPPIVPTVVTPKRVLADSHKQALLEGRRKARETKDAATGRARERLDASFVPALAPQGGRQPPRLVKK
jgi:hypothetical protein